MTAVLLNAQLNATSGQARKQNIDKENNADKNGKNTTVVTTSRSALLRYLT